jgi:RimJ/RimL family protein N-acetyltransferase
MSAQAVFNSDAVREGASRVISTVSPHNSKVSIGPVLAEDIASLFLWFNDSQAAQSDMPYRPVDCITFKEWMDQNVSLTTQILFVIRSLTPARAVGFMLFKNFQPVFRSAELGVRIGRELDRGKGYGSAATEMALDYAWNTLNLRRVSLTVFAGNDRAIAAYRKAGFQEEGVMRQAAYIEGVWHDVVLMAAINPRG